MQPSLEQRSTLSFDGHRTENAQLARTQPAGKANQAQSSNTNVGDRERMLSSILGGALLLSALRAPTPRKAAQFVGGAALLHRGITGHCYMYSALGRNTAEDSSERRAVKATITIGKSADELYRAWRDPKYVAAIMGHIAHVEDAGNGRFRWTAPLFAKRELSWTTSVTANRPGELVGWRTEQDAPFTHEGSVRFRKAPGDLGTEVTLTMTFGAQDTALRKLTEKYLRTIPRTLEESILRRSKSLCETGEIPTLEHNPSAREPVSEEKPRTLLSMPLERSLS
jgi:uncharacterized membrane protein